MAGVCRIGSVQLYAESLLFYICQAVKVQQGTITVYYNVNLLTKCAEAVDTSTGACEVNVKTSI